MPYVRARSLRWLLSATCITLVSCQKPEPDPVEPKPAPTSAAGISAATLGGEIAGGSFLLANARYIVDRRPGYEKVEVSLSAASADSPCAERKPKDAPSVWLRRKGSEPLKAEEVRLAPGEDEPWAVHYQAHDGRRWFGNGTASALVVIHGVGPDLKLSGELWACFADAPGSCVSGRFAADYCPIRIDQHVRGTAAMERPPPSDGGVGSGRQRDAGVGLDAGVDAARQP